MMCNWRTGVMLAVPGRRADGVRVWPGGGSESQFMSELCRKVIEVSQEREVGPLWHGLITLGGWGWGWGWGLGWGLFLCWVTQDGIISVDLTCDGSHCTQTPNRLIRTETCYYSSPPSPPAPRCCWQTTTPRDHFLWRTLPDLGVLSACLLLMTTD